MGLLTTKLVAVEKMKILACPNRITDESVIGFVNQMVKYQDLPTEIQIRFSTIEFVLPFATLLLAECLRDFVIYRHTQGLRTYPDIDLENFTITDGISYLMHIGFFQYIHLPIGNPPSSLPGNSNYIPIREIVSDVLIRNAGAIQVSIQVESSNLAKLVIDTETEQIMLEYCFREIIRNVFEHAGTDRCTVMGQKWHRGRFAGDVEIVIIDRGIGVYNSLRESHVLDSVEHAIIKSLQPGMSRIVKPQNKDKWENTGFGLYVLSELGKLNGEFSICSNGKVYNLTGDKFNNISFQGTGIKLRVNVSNADYFPNILEQIVRQGEAISVDIFGEKKSASKTLLPSIASQE